MSVMSDVIKLWKKVLEKTGFHYFIFNRKPLHWDGLGTLALALALALSVLVLTSLVNSAFHPFRVC